MPGSIRRYAVDFDADGHIDLWQSADDAIGSVANYLARHDWLRGQPVWTRASVAPSQREATMARLDGGISERRPLAAWNADGVAASLLPRSVVARARGRAGARGGRRGRRELDQPVDRVSELLRDHALQQEPPVRGPR
jgi:membrane-bound lytic murein transglycosylase B